MTVGTGHSLSPPFSSWHRAGTPSLFLPPPFLPPETLPEKKSEVMFFPSARSTQGRKEEKPSWIGSYMHVYRTLPGAVAAHVHLPRCALFPLLVPFRSNSLPPFFSSFSSATSVYSPRRPNVFKASLPPSRKEGLSRCILFWLRLLLLLLIRPRHPRRIFLFLLLLLCCLETSAAEA